MSDPSISPDGYWKFIDGEWTATEKQISALEKGARPHDFVEISKRNPEVFQIISLRLKQVALNSRNKCGEFSLVLKNKYSNLQRDQKLQLLTGVGAVSVTLIVILIIASLSIVMNNQAPSLNCSSENRDDRDDTCPIEIASWNLNRFGRSSAENDTIRGEMAEKISNYDIIAVQEIKDNQYIAPYLLQEEISEISEYGMILSNRTGSFCEEKSSSQISEQYAFYYDISILKPLGNYQHYPNTDCDFAREPFAGQFQSLKSDYTFVLITLHVKPDDALNEISSLEKVFEWAKFQYPNEDDFILLGDLNAGCDYATSSDRDELDIRNEDYIWIIPDNIKTNTAESRSCAYDRIILEDIESSEYLKSYSTDCQIAVSDHCIISAKFSKSES
ncbi:endonuclease/exonuclease/phosphatase family protein [Candidatus Poseidoniaceae archaeon]|nr:endonuclease/exonuclease/phosphatase family protein [Candidatus Poseidoniaceae archaeon]